MINGEDIVSEKLGIPAGDYEQFRVSSLGTSNVEMTLSRQKVRLISPLEIGNAKVKAFVL